MRMNLEGFCTLLEGLFATLGGHAPSSGRHATATLRAGTRQRLGVAVNMDGSLRFAADHEPRLVATRDGEWVTLTPSWETQHPTPAHLHDDLMTRLDHFWARGGLGTPGYEDVDARLRADLNAGLDRRLWNEMSDEERAARTAVPESSRP